MAAASPGTMSRFQAGRRGNGQPVCPFCKVFPETPSKDLRLHLVSQNFVTWSFLTGRSVGEVGSGSWFCYHPFLGHHDARDEAGP